jgi:hypothetical protein
MIGVRLAMQFRPARFSLAAIAVSLAGCERSVEPPVVYSPQPTVVDLIQTLRNTDGTFQDVPFAEVIEASTGKRVIPFDPGAEVDREILDAIRRAMMRVLDRMNGPNSLTNNERRINECSAHFEESIRHFLNAEPGIECELPRTEVGNLQRAGYPDLRLVHEASGRVVYIDPKLVEQDALKSSLRTFYYTPAEETGKILDDGSHLLIGIEHDGNTGRWKFLRWHLVDLSSFKVRLKAEFQADNRDIYRPDLILETGDSAPKPGGAAR